MKGFGRCTNCRAVRWVTPNYMSVHGQFCLRCGNNAIKGTGPLTLWERVKTCYWFCWEHIANDPEWAEWYKHPAMTARLVWSGLTMSVYADGEGYERAE